MVLALSVAEVFAVFNLNAMKSNTFAFKRPDLVLTDNFNLGQNKGRLIGLSIIEEKYKFALLICFSTFTPDSRCHTASQCESREHKHHFKTGANWCEIAARTLPHVSPGICK